jgi:hypothetical protein
MSNKAEQEEKLRILLQDVRRDKHQPDTLHQRAITEVGQELGGRFSPLRSEQHVVASTAIAYPRLPQNNPWASDPVPSESLIDATDCGDQLGYPIDGNEPATPAQPSLAQADAPPASKSPTAGNFRRRI